MEKKEQPTTSSSGGASGANKKEETKSARATAVELDPAQAWLQLKVRLESYIRCLDDFGTKHPGSGTNTSDMYKAVKRELDNFEERRSDEQLSRINRAINMEWVMDLTPLSITTEDFVVFTNEHKHKEMAVVEALTEVIVTSVSSGRCVMMSFRR